MTTPMTTRGKEVHKVALKYRDEAKRQLRLFELLNDLEPILGRMVGTCSLVRLEWHLFQEKPDLQLRYTGNAKNGEEARPDLADVMLAFGCLFDDFRGIEDEWVNSKRIWLGYYQGKFKNGLLEVDLRLQVPWHPVGCLIETYVYDPKPQVLERVVCHKDA